MSSPRIPRLWGRQQEPEPPQIEVETDDQGKWTPDDWVGASIMALVAILVGVAVAERYGWIVLAWLGVA
jgi:hypothetical protein